MLYVDNSFYTTNNVIVGIFDLHILALALVIKGLGLVLVFFYSIAFLQ